MRGGELRLEPIAGTEASYDPGLRAISVYESSIRRADTGEPLLTVVSGGFGLRLTRAQVAELKDYLENWWSATA